MKRELLTSAVVGAFGVLVLAFLMSEVNALTYLGAWVMLIAGSLSGSLHAPNPLIVFGVLFVPLFVVAFGIQVSLRWSRRRKAR